MSWIPTELVKCKTIFNLYTIIIESKKCIKQLMEKEQNYDNDGLDPSEEYFRKNKKDNNDDTYFPSEESEPPHY